MKDIISSKIEWATEEREKSRTQRGQYTERSQYLLGYKNAMKEIFGLLN